MEYQEVAICDLVKQAKEIYCGGKYELTAMFANDERAMNHCFAIYCIFAGEHTFKGLKSMINPQDGLEFPSLTPLFQVAAWYEREIHDLFGLVPIGHPDLRRLVLHENWPIGLYPLRKDFSVNKVPEANVPYPMISVQGEGIFEVPVGPIHAGIIEPGHFRFSQSGEQMIHLDAKLFFTHRGIEKGVEGLSLELGLYQAERICGACSVSHTLSYVQAIETIAHVEVPQRAQYIRCLVAEMERLYNHIGDIGNLCAGLGFSVGISQGARLKELVMRLNETITGNRFLRGMVILGGVNFDISIDISREIQKQLDLLGNEFVELMGLLHNNSVFLDRVKGTGILTRQAALDLGVVGVAARSSGVDIDLRRDHPYSIYQKLNFSVPVHASGDVAARLWVRADEVEYSMEMIRQIIENMPKERGVLAVDIPKIKPYSSGLGWSESARGSNVHWLMVGENHTIYRYFVRSASYHNWPAVTAAVPGNIIPDFPLINKSFELCYACLDR
ncbi:NADH-quinone oxidoreductase subunit C [Pelosinus sp. sgz500959]|uniref:NADH-quinone oxidoreductase subunit D-related protein n=1 Tax=Pelosinus sp. sgz500959 TaxID=3242472 RepID=UPI0036723E84